jgi:glycogen operon protein
MARCVGMLLDGRVARGLQQRTDKPGDILMMVLNSHHEDLAFTVPSVPGVVGWQTLLDTAQPGRRPHMLDAGGNFQASGRSLVLLSALHDGAVWTTAEPARARLSMPEVVILPDAMEQEAPLEASTEEASSGEKSVASEAETEGQEAEPSETR